MRRTSGCVDVVTRDRHLRPRTHVSPRAGDAGRSRCLTCFVGPTDRFYLAGMTVARISSDTVAVVSSRTFADRRAAGLFVGWPAVGLGGPVLS